ncbi:MAG: hypothetical protein WCI83_05365, partial [Thermoleophilia bacterium]
MSIAKTASGRTFTTIEIIRDLSALIGRGDRRRAGVLMLLGFVATLCDVVALLLIVPLVTTLRTGVLPPYLTGPNASVPLPSWAGDHALVVIGGACATLFVIRAMLGTLQLWWSGGLTHRAEIDIIWRLLKGSATVSYSDHLDRESGEILRAVTESVSRAMTLLGAGICAAGDLILSI